MRSVTLWTFAALIVISSLSVSCGEAGSTSSDDVAVIETNYGRIVIEFVPDKAPKHVANFKELASMSFYDGTKIHRIVKDKNGSPLAIQGGDPNTINGDPSTWGRGQPFQKTVPAEFSSNLRHERGIVSAARRRDDVNSATSQFFIVVSALSDWDGNYSIFGRVVEGMSVVDTIARAPVWPNSDRPLDPVVVGRVYLAKKGSH
jgi:cyclophilin family peptidyl-prolyl cis-trans isomerase